MHTDALALIYDQLRERFPLTLTHAFAVDDGFTEDMLILVGQSGTTDFWLYLYDDELVLSYEIPGRTQRDHGHPQSIEEAVRWVVNFMEGL